MKSHAELLFHGSYYTMINLKHHYNNNTNCFAEGSYPIWIINRQDEMANQFNPTPQTGSSGS